MIVQFGNGPPPPPPPITFLMVRPLGAQGKLRGETEFCPWWLSLLVTLAIEPRFPLRYFYALTNVKFKEMWRYSQSAGLSGRMHFLK